MSNENQSAKKIPMPHKVDFYDIQKFLAECRVKRQVVAFQERGTGMMAAVNRGEIVYLCDEDGNTHLNTGHNLREALIEAGWKDCVEAIFRIGTRQSVTGELSWAPFTTSSQSYPIRVPDFAAIDAAKAEAPAAPATPELAPVLPLTPQQ